MTRANDLRRQALRQLEDFEVLMRNGHFDYGNGFHGRVYLNPHQLVRYPSTIWRLAQDLLDVLPGELLEKVAREDVEQVLGEPPDRGRVEEQLVRIQVRAPVIAVAVVVVAAAHQDAELLEPGESVALAFVLASHCMHPHEGIR